MPPENIDDLFRDKLDGHASPPGADLWARLRAHVPAEAASTPEPAPERLDQLFQKGLSQHATPPRRELWERLEDEHLRPRQRRAAAWWPMAMAAAVALLLLVGGGLWLGSPTGNMPAGSVASQSAPNGRNAASQSASPSIGPAILDKEGVAAASQQEAVTATAAPETAGQENILAPVQKNATIRATRPAALASTPSEASKAAREQSSRPLKGSIRQLDATTEPAPQVARNSTPPAIQPAPSFDADEHQKNLENAPVLAQAPNPNPAAENVPATASGLITVDVRAGDARSAKATTSALASAEAPAERKRLGGRLLQQAGRLVRGEQVTLAELAGLPDNVTVRATVAGRTVTKSIQL
ncbi:hypothetical protein [Hymenobacter properus]|uniref:Uncharacterized protein n=1 Tax=Hymenobacter properus TaxID=2791026 RepID=A0A931BAN4_9BACT|nr:hypothetical protein [Hymenobacter properus]MBF9140259.1 hypothetical protein [Hymenobacter properus]MBR7719066.1 hypothetical protein [Microvirga sp. SRT04]